MAASLHDTTEKDLWRRLSGCRLSVSRLAPGRNGMPGERAFQTHWLSQWRRPQVRPRTAGSQCYFRSGLRDRRSFGAQWNIALGLVQRSRGCRRWRHWNLQLLRAFLWLLYGAQGETPGQRRTLWGAAVLPPHLRRDHRQLRLSHSSGLSLSKGWRDRGQLFAVLNYRICPTG